MIPSSSSSSLLPMLARATLLLAGAAVLSACNAGPQPAAPHPSTIPDARRAPSADRYPQAIPGPYDQGAYTRRERHAHTRNSAADNTPGHFDYYLLDLSWSPEYCFSHRGAPECAAHAAFVLHGLWPQNNDGTYPEDCADTPGPSDPSQYSDLYPSVSLLDHEWREHGTCSGLSADGFFTDARKAFHAVTMPSGLTHLTQPAMLSPDQVLTEFTQANPGLPRTSLALSCGHNYLTAVGVCLDKQLHPTGCGELRSCQANVVRVIPPGS